MLDNYKSYINNAFGIDDKLIDLVNSAEESLNERFKSLDHISEYNQAKVLAAFQKVGVSDSHFGWNTGYGYDDRGREVVERVFSEVFSAEDSLVRPNIVNGTHAISLAILGLLKRGDKLIYCTGKPYDTLMSTIKYAKEEGMEYDEVELLPDGSIDLDGLYAKIDDKVKMIAVQRSKGYGWRNSISVNQIEEMAKFTHENGLRITIMVDNCYCEFIECGEPLSAGADLICGSLIKNPGGGLALTGGYVSGRRDLIDQISYRLTCPGIGSECGLTFGQNRSVLQGLFHAPKVSIGALKGAILCGTVFSGLGFDVSPGVDDGRADIIQAVKLGSPEAVEAFCKGIQSAAPVDSMVKPVPSPMPGYDDEIIMAAGTFVQGSSIELSCDGPLREPYIVYFQGGLTYEHSKLGVLFALQALLNEGFINV